MNKKERILLDATLVAVIDNGVFHAKLSNGHELVVFVTESERASSCYKVSDIVEIEILPSDMSKGRILGCGHNEGKSIG